MISPAANPLAIASGIDAKQRGGANSRWLDKFNHDEDAATYDRDVRAEQDPIRHGYQRVLRWVARYAVCRDSAAGPMPAVLELGSGTGNLTVLLPAKRRVVCVDASEEMSKIARLKLGERSVEFVHDDLLGVFSRECFSPAGVSFASIVSTYALHHLEVDERARLFRSVRDLLPIGGRFVVGDLGFANQVAREARLAQWRKDGKTELVETVEDEFFWNVQVDALELRRLGFEFEVEWLGELSFGLKARKVEKPGRLVARSAASH